MMRSVDGPLDHPLTDSWVGLHVQEGPEKIESGTVDDPTGDGWVRTGKGQTFPANGKWNTKLSFLTSFFLLLKFLSKIS